MTKLNEWTNTIQCGNMRYKETKLNLFELYEVIRQNPCIRTEELIKRSEFKSWRIKRGLKKLKGLEWIKSQVYDRYPIGDCRKSLRGNWHKGWKITPGGKGMMGNYCQPQILTLYNV